jgi:nucleotide-binding universal stress UspA family protein
VNEFAKEPMKLLVAVDGSSPSLAAVEALADRLRWFRDPAELTLLYVHPPIPYKAAAAWAGRDAVASYYAEESDAALSGPRATLESRGIEHAVEKRVGDPATEIVECASAKAIDLIVMGTHGHSALANVVMGSVATRVVAMTSIPVLLLKR